MWKNYITTAFRNIIRSKGFSLINIIGLSIGMACSILIFLWIQYEMSFDKYNEKSDCMYRLVQSQLYSTGPLITTCMPAPIAKDIKDEIPEILNSFIYSWNSALFSYEEKTFKETAIFSDSCIFQMIDFEFIEGNPENIFKDENSIVITDEIAEKFFGEEDPMGKVIMMNNNHPFKVNGIIKKPPKNSSFQVKLIIPFNNVEKFGWTIDRYGWNSYYVYVELDKETDYKEVNTKIKKFLQIKANDPDDEEESNIDLYLFPFEKMHLHSVRGSGGDIQYIYIFSAVALFILIIACINFMNLATARSARRSREIGIRKTLGASRKQVVTQFFGESFLMCLIAFIIAIILVESFLPAFNNFQNTELSINFFQADIIIGLVIILLFVSIISGSYPALYLSHFRPIGTLKGELTKGKGGKAFRRVLVIFQFTLSVILIICTLVIFNQMKFLQDSKLGINKENVVYKYMRGTTTDKYEVLKTELLKNPNIESVSRGSHLPFWMGSNSGGFDWEGSEGNNDILIGFTSVDFDYAKTMGLKISEGRFYDESFATDTTKIFINERLAGFISDEEALGKWLSWGDNYKVEIVGIAKDFHHLPMTHEIDPLVMLLSPERCGYLFIRINPDNNEDAMNHITASWEKLHPNFPSEFSFLDQAYTETYQNEKRLGEIFKFFTTFAIIIACLGLFGLAAFMAEQKSKEIGIRKVFGANITTLSILMSKSFLIWVIISNIIAWPIAWYAMKSWLENYVYHTDLSIWFFVFAAIVSIGISLLTVSFHTIR
ncbi:ABC transporter permease, partial [Bacteroidota bacterium]